MEFDLIKLIIVIIIFVIQIKQLELLEATGVVAVPGSGFRQKGDTWHFR